MFPSEYLNFLRSDATRSQLGRHTRVYVLWILREFRYSDAIRNVLSISFFRRVMYRDNTIILVQFGSIVTRSYTIVKSYSGKAACVIIARIVIRTRVRFILTPRSYTYIFNILIECAKAKFYSIKSASLARSGRLVREALLKDSLALARI